MSKVRGTKVPVCSNVYHSLTLDFTTEIPYVTTFHSLITACLPSFLPYCSCFFKDALRLGSSLFPPHFPPPCLPASILFTFGFARIDQEVNPNTG